MYLPIEKPFTFMSRAHSTVFVMHAIVFGHFYSIETMKIDSDKKKQWIDLTKKKTMKIED